MKKISLRSGLMATTTLLSSLAIPALLATVATMAPATAEAQDYTSGAVVISVRDANGAPVAGATVTLTSQAQGITKTMTTSSTGSATAVGLAPGEYNINVVANGFDTYAGTATVIVSQSVTYTYSLQTTGASQTVVVKGKRVRQDFNKTTTGLSVDLTTLVAQQPIGRTLEAVTLLAPTVVNSTAFGEPSIGGGSAAENAYYVNGLNVTNPDTYVGLAAIPFDFYKTVDIQTSGVAAEFGRATGGVINATTKTGTNNFMFAIHGNFAPDALRATQFATPQTTSPAKYRVNDGNTLILESGGALIKDKLFLYGLVQLTDTRAEFASTSSKYLEKDKTTDPFYGLKADWYITPSQHLELTYFDTTSHTKQMRYSYNGNCPDGDFHTFTGAASTAKCLAHADIAPAVAATIGTTGDAAQTTTGGASWVAKYTGNITDWFTLSAAYGDTKYASDFASANPTAFYAQTFNGTAFVKNAGVKQAYSAATTVDDWERKFQRVDADMRFEGLGKHHIRFGMDNEDLSMTKTTILPGAQPIRYYLLPSYSYGYILYEHLGGKVSSKDTAYYVQDSWDVTPTLNLQLGLRQDDFQANNLSGEKYLSLTGNLAPRVGISWKPSTDSKWRFTAYYGQEYIPPAMNLGFRGKDLYFVEYFDMPAGGYVLDANGIPVNMGTPRTGYPQICPASDSNAAPGNLGASGGHDACAVFGDGTQEPAAAKAAVGLKATRSSEVTLGAYYRANDLWSFDVTMVHRNLDRVSEDTDFAPQINTYCLSKPHTASQCQYANEYHVWNVGDSVSINTFKTLPDGTKNLTFTGLGFPTPKRKYDGITFDFKRQYDGKWALQGSYTYSRSTGNYEGTVLSLGSGTGQVDAGSTQLYDYVGLTEHGDGVLINDHDHEFKFFGSYNINDNFSVGVNVQVLSPGYLSCYGRYPDTLNPAFPYGASSHYCIDKNNQTAGAATATTTDDRYGYLPAPQGKGGKTDWTKQIDLSLRYTVPDSAALGGKLVLRADIFNLFNSKEITARNMASDIGAGNPNTSFLQPTAYNASRFMRIGFDLSY